MPRLHGRDRAAHRDAIGMILATRRGDEDAIEWLIALQPSLKNPTTDALVAIVCALMRELDTRGLDSNELMRRWAMRLAERESS